MLLVMVSMSPREAWGAFTLVFVLAMLSAAATALNWGYAWYEVAAFVIIASSMYAYVVYKRYEVEVVPESDIMLFNDPDDLRILCDIYGLDTSGGARILRQRLTGFARLNSDRAFVLVVPPAVHALGSALAVKHEAAAAAPEEPMTVPALVMQMVSDRAVTGGPLVGGMTRSSARLSTIRSCPVCDSQPPKSGSVCKECGADLEFYAVLAETKVGQRLLSKKAEAARRKLRYPVPHLQGR
jgi:hypothetical protein